MISAVVLSGLAALFVGAVLELGPAPAFLVGVVIGVAVLGARDGLRKK